MADVLINREYKTMGGFIRGVRSSMVKVIGHDDYMTLEDDTRDGRNVEQRIRDGENVYYNEGCIDEDSRYRIGFDIEFPDRIYVYYEIENKIEDGGKIRWINKY